MKVYKKIISVTIAALMLFCTLSSCGLGENTAFMRRNESSMLDKKPSEKKERLPGLVFWGGTTAYGSGADGNNIEKVVEEHMMSDECYIPVANMGVPTENNQTIMARCGAVDTLVEEFTIPENTDKVRMKIYTSNKSAISPLTYGTRWDGGMTDVTIAGVRGELSVDSATVSLGDPVYYFSRNTYGEEKKVSKGEKLVSMSMTDYKDYIPVVCMGENGYWTSFKDLADQIEKVIKTSSNSDKYIVLGLFTVPLLSEQLGSIDTNDEKALEELTKKNNIAYDKYMKKRFGEHYLSLRETICSEEAVEKLKKIDDGVFNLTEQDEKELHSGIVSSCVRYNKTILNQYGYSLVGDALYEKLVDMGYLYH